MLLSILEKLLLKRNPNYIPECKDWKVGDVIRSYSSAPNQFTRGSYYLINDITKVSGDWMVKVTDDAGNPNGWSASNFSWVQSESLDPVVIEA